jgi:hypothetical protein
MINYKILKGLRPNRKKKRQIYSAALDILTGGLAGIAT